MIDTTTREYAVRLLASMRGTPEMDDAVVRLKSDRWKRTVDWFRTVAPYTHKLDDETVRACMLTVLEPREPS